jgi:hypothetical protein
MRERERERERRKKKFGKSEKILDGNSSNLQPVLLYITTKMPSFYTLRKLVVSNYIIQGVSKKG